MMGRKVFSAVRGEASAIHLSGQFEIGSHICLYSSLDSLYKPSNSCHSIIESSSDLNAASIWALSSDASASHNALLSSVNSISKTDR
jgi:hypothetical protein